MLTEIDTYPISFSAKFEFFYDDFKLKDNDWESIQNIVPNNSYAESLMLKFHFGESL